MNTEMILTKEQMYDMFQQILGVKKFEHQLLFNALQVNNMCILSPYLSNPSTKIPVKKSGGRGHIFGTMLLMFVFCRDYFKIRNSVMMHLRQNG